MRVAEGNRERWPVWRIVVAVVAVALLMPLPVIFLATPAEAATLAWADQWSSEYQNAATDVLVDGSGNVYVAGGEYTPSGTVRKYLADHSAAWATPLAAYVEDIALGPAGASGPDVFAVYETYDETGDLGFVYKLTPAGTPSLFAVIDDIGDDQGVSAVASDPSGRVFVAGWYAVGDTYHDFVRAYSSTGSVLWTVTGIDDYVSDIVATATGVFIAGGVNEPSTLFVNQYSPTTGTLVWSGSATGFTIDGTGDLAVAPGGHVFAVATIWTTTAGHEALLVEFDPSESSPAAPVRTVVFGAGSTDRADDVAIASDGIYVSGTTNGRLGPDEYGYVDAYVRKFGADGKAIWTQQYGTGGTAIEWMGTSVAATATADTVYVAGSTTGAFVGTFEGNPDAYVGRLGPPTCAAPAFTDLPASDIAEVGEDLWFGAGVSRSPCDITFEWEYSADDVTWAPATGTLYSDEDWSDITLGSITESHEGWYRVTATNREGSTSASARLYVADNAFSITSATRSQGWTTVTWTTPTGDPALTNFVCDLGHGRTTWIPCTSGVAVKGGGKTVTVGGFTVIAGAGPAGADLVGPTIYTTAAPITRAPR